MDIWGSRSVLLVTVRIAESWPLRDEPGLLKCPHLRYARMGCILFIPKYRRKDFFKEARKEIGEIPRTLCEYQDVEWVKMCMNADHVHRYMRIPLKLSVSEFMGYLKGKSARMVFGRFPQMKPGRGGIT